MGAVSRRRFSGLENTLHDLVGDETMTLRSVQQQIAANWQALYREVFGVGPSQRAKSLSDGCCPD